MTRTKTEIREYQEDEERCKEGEGDGACRLQFCSLFLFVCLFDGVVVSVCLLCVSLCVFVCLFVCMVDFEKDD